jgi:DNA repair protein RadC
MARKPRNRCLPPTPVQVRDVFREAIRRNATSVIIAHNHPSADPTLSYDDVAVTRTLVEAGNLMDIEVRGHLVIGNQRYVTMKERRLGFK